VLVRSLGGVEGVREGPERWSAMAQRWRARRRRGGEAGGGGRKGGCSFYSCQRRWEEGDVVAATVGEAKRRWPWSEGCRCGWAPLFGQGPRLVGPAWFHYFLNYPKLVETCTIEMDALSCSKNLQFMHESSIEYSKQLSQ
jgi:hypothetical protein